MHVTTPIRSLYNDKWDIEPTAGRLNVISASNEERQLAKRLQRKSERSASQRRKSSSSSRRRRRSLSLNKSQELKQRDELRARLSFGPPRDSSDDLSSLDDVDVDKGKGKEKAHHDEVNVDRARAIAADISKRRGIGDRFDMKPRWEEDQDLDDVDEEDDDRDKSSGAEDGTKRALRERMRSREREIREEKDDEDGDGERVIRLHASQNASDDDDRKTTADDDGDDDGDDGDRTNVDRSKQDKMGETMRRVMSFDDQLTRKKKDVLDKSAQSVALEDEATPSTKAKRSKTAGGGKSEGEGTGGNIKGTKTKTTKKNSKQGNLDDEGDDGAPADVRKRHGTDGHRHRKKKKDVDDEKKIKAWLRELNLPAEYLQLFQQDGFDDMKTIQLITGTACTPRTLSRCMRAHTRHSHHSAWVQRRSWPISASARRGTGSASCGGSSRTRPRPSTRLDPHADRSHSATPAARSCSWPIRPGLRG
jgi:hypothetical protein